MKRLLTLTIFCTTTQFLTAGLGAQSLDFFQAPLEPIQLRPPASSYLGVSLAEIDSKRAGELKLKEPAGVEITRVEEGSPAEKAGLKPGDVVLEFNGQHVDGMEQFGRMVRETPPGRESRLLISRNGATQTLMATLATRRLRPFSGNFGPGFEFPEFHMPDMPQIIPTLRNHLLGVEAESLGPQLAAYFGVKQGVLVRAVLKDTAAEKAGIRAGDVITKVEGSAVASPGELSSAVRSASSKTSAFSVELVRDHKEMSVSLTIEDGRSERAAPRAPVVHNGIRL
jgi:serine protease Do